MVKVKACLRTSPACQRSCTCKRGNSLNEQKFRDGFVCAQLGSCMMMDPFSASIARIEMARMTCQSQCGEVNLDADANGSHDEKTVRHNC